MRNLLFLFRLIFIANCCYVLSWFLKGGWWLPHAMASTIIVWGVALSFFMNLSGVLVLLITAIYKKPLWDIIPGWLWKSNLLFFIAQLMLLLK